MRKELICCVTRFLIPSPFMLAVDGLLSPVMIPLNQQDKKPTGLLTISLPGGQGPAIFLNSPVLPQAWFGPIF